MQSKYFKPQAVYGLFRHALDGGFELKRGYILKAQHKINKQYLKSNYCSCRVFRIGVKYYLPLVRLYTFIAIYTVFCKSLTNNFMDYYVPIKLYSINRSMFFGIGHYRGLFYAI